MLEHRQEIVAYSPHVPIKLFIHKLGDVSRHWHRSLEMLLVLEGEIDITVDAQVWHLQSDDIILVNAGTMHSLHSSGAILIAVQINLEKFLVPESNSDSLYFECNSQNREHPEGYAALKSLVARMLKQGAGDSPAADFHNQALAYTFFATLLENFSIAREQSEQSSRKQLDRIKRILTYINEHYRDNLTLQQVADAEGLSVPYLSMFFEKKMGINFSSYYSNLRLEHAAEDLLETKDSIETIAQRNGYTETHTFIRSFKKQFGCLPSAYRKSQGDLIPASGTKNGINYLALEPGNYLQLLTRYLPQTNAMNPVLPAVRKQAYPDVDCSSHGRQFGKAIHKFIGVGSAHELLFQDIQTMLAEAQREIGFEFVKFHGLLSDEMLVCSRQGDTLKFSFVLIDKVIDFLTGIGLKPMIQLSFMPACLAEQPSKRVFWDRFITSLPRDFNEWNQLVQATVRHLLTRYGREQVRSWLFTVWNEPDVSDFMFSVGDDDKFREFYARTYQTIKNEDASLVVGAPSNLPIAAETQAWMEAFLRWTIDHDCRPQFINIHYYSDDFDNAVADQHGPAGLTANCSFKADPDNFKTYIDRVHEIRESTGLGDLPIYLTEFNLTVSHRNLINDTCFSAVWLARNILLNDERLDSFGYWSLTDLIGENQPAEDLFHGGMGMFTRNGIRKPAFYLYWFARQMRGECIARGDNYVVVRKPCGIRILSWNYEHFNDLFAKGELFDMTAINRYTPFNRQQAIHLHLPLTNLPVENLTVREYYINRSQGSAFDQWVAMGAQPLETAAEIELLRQSVHPGYHKTSERSVDGAFEYQVVLEPHEVRLTEIDCC